MHWDTLSAELLAAVSKLPMAITTHNSYGGKKNKSLPKRSCSFDLIFSKLLFKTVR